MSSANPNDFLSAYHDREATPNEESAAKALVEGSPEASREVKDYQRLSRLIQELPRLGAPPEFAAAVMQRAERESLIPLDPVAPRGSAATGPEKSLSPRRRWWLAGAATVSVAAALLIAANIFGTFKPRAPRDEIARQESGRLPGDMESRKISTSPVRPSVLDREEEGVAHSESTPFAAVAAKDGSNHHTSSDAKADAVRRTSVATAATPATPAVVASPLLKGAPPSMEASDRAHELALMLPANLKTAKVGDVVEALQQDGQQVAVVRLTVVNQVEGLDGVQSLLVRNTSRTLQNVDEIKQMRQHFAVDKSAHVSKAAVPSAAGDMICVYVEGSRDEMLGVLQDLQNERHIQAAELTNTISFTTLEEYARRAVPSQKQDADRSAVANTQIVKGAVAQTPKASGSQMAVSLPASTVDKILTARQSTANSRVQNSKTETGQVASQLPSAVDAPADRLDVANRQATKEGQTAITARRSASGRSGSGAVAKQRGRSQLRDSNEVAATQKPFQIFFVITDQPQAQTNQPPMNAAKAAAAPAKRSDAGQTAPAAKAPANSPPPNQAP
jgi:hypothetical protein